jgi:SagB-type dehydrogenase family enzyme
VGNDLEAETNQKPDLETLTRIFYFSAGITKHLTDRPTGKTISFRAAACTGGLFHIEFYLVCGDTPGLEAGVYHLDPQGPSIRQLRAGDYRRVLVEASGHEPSVEQAPVILIATDVIGRNSIKYQAREYRHAFWDSGTILANTLASAAAHQLSARVIAGFVDATVSSLLDLDPQRELALALVPISAEPGATTPSSPSLDPLNLAVLPIADHEIDFPAIRTMHVASMLFEPEAVAAWRGAAPRNLSLPPAGPLIPLQPLTRDTLPIDSLEQVIVRRGSTRQFTHESITFEQLSTVLYQSLQGVPADFLEPPNVTLNDVYLTIHAVDGLVPGTYVLRRDKWALELLKPGDFRETSGYLGLEQELAYDASVNIFFLADLHPILECFGNRGYRAAQFEAGISGGRMYLASYAQHFGATGLTFYDDAVIDFFSPHAHNKSVMFMIALGHKAGRRG